VHGLAAMRATARALVVGALLVNVCCADGGTQATSHPVLRFVTAPSGAFIEHLVSEYTRTAPSLQIRRVVSSESSILSVQRGDADVALSQADAIYLAYQSAQRGEGEGELVGLRAIATTQTLALHLIAARESRIRSVAGLNGRRLGVSPDSPAHDLVMDALGVSGASLSRYAYPDQPQLVGRLAGGDIDAIFVRLYYPVPLLDEVLKNGAYLLPIEGPGIERLIRDNPFLRPISIPAGTYAGQTEPIRTLGVDVVLICREDLDERIVYELTRGFLESIPHLASSYLNVTDGAGAPSTPIPLHPGAALYYRESELFQ
jgi:uncharacterized protein